MSKRIARVFPRKTNMSPDDSLAFFGEPTIEAMAADIEEVHISVTFTWDLERAEELYESWQLLGVPVEVGGPAFDDRMGDFTPGMYLKQGMTVTSRGCSKDCWFCSVPRCARGVIRELPIQDGWNILDDNILGTSESHFRGVIEMLRRQPERAVFSGGLEPGLLQPWQAELLRSINPRTMYTAYDTKDDYEALRQMARIMWDAGFSRKGHQVKCYALCGYEGGHLRGGAEADGADHGAGLPALCDALPGRGRSGGPGMAAVSAGVGQPLYRWGEVPEVQGGGRFLNRPYEIEWRMFRCWKLS